MDAPAPLRSAPDGRQSLLISLVLFGLCVLVWHLATRLPSFDPRGLNVAQLQHGR